MKEKPILTIVLDYCGATFVVKKFREKRLDIHLRTVIDLQKFSKYCLSRSFFLVPHYRDLSVDEIHRMNLIKRRGFWRALEVAEKKLRKGIVRK